MIDSCFLNTAAPRSAKRLSKYTLFRPPGRHHSHENDLLSKVQTISPAIPHIGLPCMPLKHIKSNYLRQFHNSRDAPKNRISFSRKWTFPLGETELPFGKPDGGSEGRGSGRVKVKAQIGWRP